MISLKSKAEIEIMAEGGRILAKIFKDIEDQVVAGIITKELDRIAETLIFRYKAKPAFKGYEKFPACLCVSVNETIVHGVPSDYQLHKGDVVSLDLGIQYKGFFTDMAVTLLVNEVSGNSVDINFFDEFNDEKMRLIKTTKKALELAIHKIKPDNNFGDLGYTIQKYVEKQGFNVIRDLVGHGIGRQLHEEPQVPNFGEKNKGEKLKPGMVFCLEPMVVVGDWRIKKTPDGYGFQTSDDSLSAHFEHTIAITENGPRVLTI